MRSAVALVCGIVIVASLSLTWLKVSALGYVFLRTTGWDVMRGEVEVISSIGPVLALAGAAVLIACAIGSAILSKIIDPASPLFQYVRPAARIAAVVSGVGSAIYLVAAIDLSADTFAVGTRGIGIDIGLGAWLAAGMAVVAAFAGINIPETDWRRQLATPRATSASRDITRRGSYRTPHRARAIDPGIPPLPRPPGASRRPLPQSGEKTAKEIFDWACDLESSGRDDEAVAAYGEAIRREPSYALAYYNRGSLYMQHEHPGEAIRDFRQVVELSDDAYLSRMAQNRLEELNRQIDELGWETA